MPEATILIVEDEILIAEDLKNKLKQAGYQDVATAASGEEALRLAAVRSPDLVLMDIRLSGRLDGIQAAEALNAGQQTAIIYLTAFANDEIIERAKKTRPCGYLLKPYSELELRTNIEMALYRMEAEKKLQESEERFRAIAESSHDAIMISDRDGTIIYVNNAARAVFGYDARELLGASDRCLVAGPLQGRHVEARERAGVHGMSDVLGRTVESLARKKDGTEFPIEMSVSSWEAGGQRHFSITVRDITRRKLAEEELKVQARNLEEVNAALKVLLKNREEEKTELEETVMSNLKGLVFPYTEKLKTQLRDQRHLLLLETIETNLNKVVSPFSRRLSSQFYDLTPHEIKIANLIREGKATKEIADLLNATPRAVEFHRNNLRKKLGISNKKTNLRSFLLSFSR